ncbi:MAG TPA: LysR family transcriptional regulator [Polyangiaceae bacterium]|nr:LysR family transcriptional regulator [Polyangiaceae bacterium]
MHEAKQSPAVASTQRQAPPFATSQLAWDDLRILLAVIRQQSVRGAATQLGLNASTVSRRLAALEFGLGTRLFERHPTGLRLTHAGEEAAKFGTQLEEEMLELRIRLGNLETEPSGLLRVTCAEVVAATSTRLLGDFLAAHPKITAEFHVSDGFLRVERHEVDIAIRVADSPGDQLTGRKVGASAVGLFASRGYVAARGRTLSEPHHAFVEWPRGVEHKPAFRWLDEHYGARTKVLRANSANAVLGCVRAGLGVAPLGLDQGRAEPDLELLEALPADCSTPVWLLTHRDVRSTARVRAALDYFAERFPAALDP